MVALISFAYLFVAAIYVSGTLGVLDFEDYSGDRWYRKRPHELRPWDRDLLRHGVEPKWLHSRRLRYDYNNVRYDPGWPTNEAASTANAEKHGSVKAGRKYLNSGIHPRSGGYIWGKEDDISGHPQGLRHPVFRSRLDAVHSGAINPDVDRWTVVSAKNSRVQPLKPETAEDVNYLEPKTAGEEGEIAEAIHVEENSTTIGSNEGAGHPESGVEANENGTSEEEVKSEVIETSTAEETGTTEAVPESSGVEEATTPSVSDKVDDGISKSSFPASTVTVKETAATVYSKVDHTSPKEISPSATTFPSTAVTDSETVSTTPSTAGESSSEGISPSSTPLPPSVVTANETVSSTPSAASDSSSKIVSPSTTPLPSSTVTVSETASFSPSAAGDSSSKIVSPSKTPLSSSVVTVSETVSPTPSTAGDSSSKGGSPTSPTLPTTEHVIVLPRIRSARIVLSSVLLAIGLVVVAVAAVCIFRERRRKLKYDQLKLLP